MATTIRDSIIKPLAEAICGSKDGKLVWRSAADVKALCPDFPDAKKLSAYGRNNVAAYEAVIKKINGTPKLSRLLINLTDKKWYTRSMKDSKYNLSIVNKILATDNLRIDKDINGEYDVLPVADVGSTPDVNTLNLPTKTENTTIHSNQSQMTHDSHVATGTIDTVRHIKQHIAQRDFDRAIILSYKMIRTAISAWLQSIERKNTAGTLTPQQSRLVPRDENGNRDTENDVNLMIEQLKSHVSSDSQHNASALHEAICNIETSIRKLIESARAAAFAVKQNRAQSIKKDAVLSLRAARAVCMYFYLSTDKSSEK